MCGDSHLGPAPYRGGAMAAIRVLTNSSIPSSEANYILRFSNPESSHLSTQVTCDTLGDDEIPVPTDTMNGAKVYIHKFGYLVGTEDSNISTPKNPVLHDLTVGNKASMLNGIDGPLRGRLGFDVSEHGVIGRGVSVVKEGKKIGFGVIGWQ